MQVATEGDESMSRPSLRRFSLAVMLALATGCALGAAASCNATSGVVVPTVVELYTSEGCSSCPPADRWLSSLSGRPDVVRLAFHVDYWDRLGWKDRFADAAYTQRQKEVSRRAGGHFVYTPQVIVDGADFRAWPELPSATPRPSTVQVALSGGDGKPYVARIVRGPGAPLRLTAFWAVTEDGHVSQVKAGENSGATLRHDAVVLEYAAVDNVAESPLRFEPRSAAKGGTGRHVQLVVTDASTGRPVQALGC
jgi:hypothetical protein